VTGAADRDPLASDPLDRDPVHRKLLRLDLAALEDRELALVAAIAVVALALLGWMLLTVLEPPPPRQVAFASGAPGGAYQQFADRYARAFAGHGITLHNRATQGSVENLQLLRDPASGVAAALVQGGLVDEQQAPELESLASVAYEPIWVLMKPGHKVSRLSDLLGQRVAIGPEGSGSRRVALQLFAANGIDERNTRLLPTGGLPALEQLADGSLDAVFTILAVGAPLLLDARRMGFVPLSFDQRDAYLRRFQWLSPVTLPRGGLDLAADLPRSDVHLLAVTANLVVRKDLHPAISYLLLDVASDLHRNGSLLTQRATFPAEFGLDLPQSAESKRFFKTGRPFLQRYLPFWMANVIERLLVSIVPVLVIALPLMRALPAFAQWRQTSRILRLYDRIHAYEASALIHTEPPGSVRARLDAFEADLAKLRLPTSRLVDYYNVKAHLEMLRQRAAGASANQAGGTHPPA